MRFFLAVIALYVASCTSEADGTAKKHGIDDAEVQRLVDSLTNAASNESIVNSLPDSTIAREEKIAFNSVSFGANSNDCRQKINEYGFTEIGTDRYLIRPFYFKDELYKIEIESLGYSATYLDLKIPQLVENLKSTISAKYPNVKTMGGFPSILNLNAGYITWMYNWTVGKKEIKLGVLASTTHEYSAVCWIYDSDRKRKIETNNTDVADSVRKAASAKF